MEDLRDRVAVVTGAASGIGRGMARALVGEGAKVGSGTSLERSVVWDGVEVPKGEWQDVIFTQSGPVQVDA